MQNRECDIKYTLEELKEKFLESSRVYGRILLSREDDEGATEEGNKITVQVSLINAYMLNLDDMWLSSEDNDVEKYYPYFYEFFADIDSDAIKEVKKQGLTQGKIVPMYLSTEKMEKEFSWYGELIFAASPLKRYGRYLNFSKEDYIERDDINRKFKKYGRQYLTGRFKSYLGEVDQSCLLNEIPDSWVTGGSVYNVGQGSFVKVEFSFGSNILLFDAGMTYRSDDLQKGEVSAALEEIQKLHPDIIVLSHWDTDHILGITLLSYKEIYEQCTWIAPNILLLSDREISFSAARLCLYLMKKRRIALIANGLDVSQKLGVMDHCALTMDMVKVRGNFYLYQGKGTRSPNGRKNNIGLYIDIVNDEMCNCVHALFMGDCAYSEISPVFFNRCQFLLAAHHGSQNTLPTSFQRENKSTCVISAGKNSCGHPDAQHVNALEHCGFEVIETDGKRQIDFFFGRRGVWTSCVDKCGNCKEVWAQEIQCGKHKGYKMYEDSTW